MQLVLASGNPGKLREFQAMFGGVSVVPFGALMAPFEIVEDGHTFAENARIKARAIYEKLGGDYLVVADDSGISLPLLQGAPGIYSARYAGKNATDTDNLFALIDALKARGVASTPAYYTAAIAIVGGGGTAPGSRHPGCKRPIEYVVHGWMHGHAVDTARGDKGFGYDPIFVPEGYDRTLGELGDTAKAKISHRSKALALARPIITMVQHACAMVRS